MSRKKYGAIMPDKWYDDLGVCETGHKIGNLFGVTAKKPEPDEAPRTRQGVSSARMKRLEKTFI